MRNFSIRVRVWLRRLALCCAFAFVAWLAVSALVVNALTRRFEREPDGVNVPPGSTLAAVETRSADGLRLMGQVLEVPHPRAALLCLHGSGDSRRAWNLVLPQLAELDVLALMPDLRAHGLSEGELNDFGWGARADVHAWLTWLEVQHAELPRVVAGISMGSAAALFASLEDGPPVAGYLLESCYLDLDSASRNRLNERLPAPLAGLAALGMRLISPLFLDLDLERDSPLAAARSLAERGHVPTIVLGTRGDPWARAEEQAVLAVALGTDTRLEIVEGQGHVPMLARNPAGYAQLLDELLPR